MQPGYVVNHRRFIAAPAGRIHFAGEHTASWTGFMEGALESAERVTKEVLAYA
jgi:monoamine oxidase